LKTAALACVGDDAWAEIVRRQYAAEGIETRYLQTCPGGRTSVTIVLVNDSGERSFIFDPGSAGQLTLETFRAQRDLLAQARFLLFGYYALVPAWDEELPEIMALAREAGCKTALDAAGNGGDLTPLAKILPHLDVYVPSLHEGRHQTGRSAPREIINFYRQAGARGLVGVKLGAQGALLSPAAGEFIEIAPVAPPGPVVDTTGAGDAFYAGLLAGLLRGQSVAEAGRLAAAAGACCVTGLGASAGLRSWEETQRLIR
jgi:sugar/nucleoside kinase (ribokinase family)